MSTRKSVDFAGQDFFLGLDVHSKNWEVTVRTNHMQLKTFSMDPSPSVLVRYMHRTYPGGRYLSAYEAGFCGFWIHRALTDAGFENIVVHPADVPTSHKEKDRKSDRIDSRKLARERENGNLEAIYIPDEAHQHLRSLVRLRDRIVINTTRVKNRIKSYLHFNGIPIIPHAECCHWSNRFIEWLEGLEFSTLSGTEYLRSCIDELRYHRQQLADITRSLRTATQDMGIGELITLLCTIPGVGFVTAITYYSELVDVNRFPDFDNLASYVGLIPSTWGSGPKETDRGLTKRRKRLLRHLIIEAAWIATRTDPVLLHRFNKLTRRMKKQEAIIRIAKNLLSRFRSVWRKGAPYCLGVVE